MGLKLGAAGAESSDMKLSTWLVVLTLAAGVLACRTTDEEHRQRLTQNDQDLAPIEPTPMTAEEKVLYSTGCVRSVSQCFNSCPSHKYMAERNLATCPEASGTTWVCFCKN